MPIIAPRCQPAENSKLLILLNDEVLTTHIFNLNGYVVLARHRGGTETMSYDIQQLDGAVYALWLGNSTQALSYSAAG